MKLSKYLLMMVAAAISFGVSSCNDEDDLVGTVWKSVESKDEAQYEVLTFATKTDMTRDVYFLEHGSWMHEVEVGSYSYNAPNGSFYIPYVAYPFTVSGNVLTVYDSEQPNRITEIFYKQ